MKTAVGIIALVTSLLAGCGSPSGSAFSSSSAADLGGNWQIQSSANSTTTSTQGVVLQGGLESSGSQVSGNFRFTNLAQSSCGVNQVVSLSGTMGSKSNLTLSSVPLSNGTTIKVSLKMAGAQPYSGIGTVEVDGATCSVASGSAIGSQIASTTGIYSGVLSPGTSDAPVSGDTGTATITLTQSSAAGSDGKFGATGTLNYRFGSCEGKVPLSGSVSGVGLSFWDVIITSGNLQEIDLTGTTNLDATQITAGYLSLSPAPCSKDSNSSAVFYGTFDRQ